MYIYPLLLIYLISCKIKFIYLLYFIQCVKIRGSYDNLWNLDKNHINLTKKLNLNKHLFINNKINFNDCKLYKKADWFSTHNTSRSQVYELQQIDLTEVNKLNENVINKIDSLSKDLYNENLSRVDLIKQLTTIGREVYLNSPNHFLFQKLPNKVNLLKEFDTNDLLNYNEGVRDYFIIKSPECVKYKLLQDCSFFIYFSVLVDENNYIYIDGTSESLIYRGIISIIISIINNSRLSNTEGINTYSINDNTIHSDNNILTKSKSYISDILTNNGLINKIADLNLINKNTINSIINHLQNEYNRQLEGKYRNNLGYDGKRNQIIEDIGTMITNDGNAHNDVNKDDSSDVDYNLFNKTPLKKVAVLLSGGVDSSLSLWTLKNRGYYVEAFYLQVNDIKNDTGTCKSEDLKYAKEVCKKIGVKLNVLPFSKLYYDDILKDFIENYKRGEVPNPDVLCNNKIKFGQFLDRAINWGFDYVASGHYASIVEDRALNEDRRIRRLVTCKDPIKDQTYFLSRLNQFQLSKLIFPLEHLTKQQVREYARTIGLPSFNKDDSVGLCFLEDLNIGEYLLDKLGENRGLIVDYKTSQIIGEHLGLFNYSIGQRRNLNNYIYRQCNPNTLRYVIKKDLENNVLYVTEDYDSREFTQPGGVRSSFKIKDIFFNSSDYMEVLKKCKIDVDADSADTHGDSYKLRVKLRHSPKFYDSIIRLYKNRFDINNKNKNNGSYNNVNGVDDVVNSSSSVYNEGIVYLNEPDSGISTGQYCVFYLDDFCLGSAKMITNN